MKRSILIGSLSGLDFTIQTAKIDHLQINFAKFLQWNVMICLKIGSPTL